MEDAQTNSTRQSMLAEGARFDAGFAGGVQQLVDRIFQPLLFLLQALELLFDRGRIVVEGVGLESACAFCFTLALCLQIGILASDDIELRLQALQLIAQAGDDPWINGAC